MHVDASLSGGSILVIGTPSGASAELLLRSDSASPIKQWFHFRATGVAGESVELVIVNAGEATFIDGFQGYRALASYDLSSWFRVPTHFDGRRLVLSHQPETDEVFYSYFAAYPQERHDALLRAVDGSPLARVVTIGQSVEGRPIDLCVVGEEGPDKRRVWIVARQHPGETMSEWFAEGALERLLDEDDELSRALLGEAVVYVVPNANPDGCARGNFRTNAAGQDSNREWAFPSAASSPEVLAIRAAIEDTGCDLFLDVHGEESVPRAFGIGCVGNPHYSERLYLKERALFSSLAGKDPAFDPDFDYGPDDPGKGDLRIANNWVGERFDCLSVTLEMPFKDIDKAEGFSPERAKGLGRSSLESALESLLSNG